jgi:hypothetical protein
MERTVKFRALQVELMAAAQENDATLLMEKQVKIEWFIDGQLSLEIVKANMHLVDASLIKAMELHSTGEEGYKHLRRKDINWLRIAQSETFRFVMNCDTVKWMEKHLEIEYWVQNLIDQHVLDAAKFLVTAKAKHGR